MDIIPKPIQKLPILQNILFYSSVGFLLTVVSIWLVLQNSIGKAENELGKLEETLRREKTAEELNLERDVISWQKKINDFSRLLAERAYPSRVFDLLGDVSHPKSWFQNVSLDVSSAKVTVSGQTQSFITLGQQLSILDANPLIKNFTLASLSAGAKGKVEFSIDIYFDPKILKTK